MRAVWALALSAGAIAGLNPCGFGLLPSYLAVFVRTTSGVSRLEGRVARALLTSASLTAGFMLVFFVAGVVLEGAGSAVQRRLPLVTLTVGFVVIALGVASMTGRTLGLPKLAPRARHRSASVPSMIGFGATFAAASFSCTVGPFLAVVAVARDESFVASIGVYMAYAIGMGTVVTVLAISAAFVGPRPRRFRRLSRFAPQLGGTVMILSGAYAIWYARWELRVYGGDLARDRLVERVDGWRNALAGIVDDNLPVLVVVVVASVAVCVAALTLTRRRDLDVNR